MFKNPMADDYNPSSIPAFPMGDGTQGLIDNYKIRYLKGSLDNEAFVIELQAIETECLKGDRLVLLDRETFSFQDSFFVVLRYMERRT